MSKEDGKHLLDRLLSASSQSENKDVSGWHLSDLKPYIDHQLWPGKNYLLAGHSYFSQYRIIGTDLETRRAGFIAVLCEHGDRHHCIELSEVLRAEGFDELLDEDEKHWLASLPIDTLIGPAYDPKGNRIPTAFAIWRAVEEDATVHLQIAHR